MCEGVRYFADSPTQKYMENISNNHNANNINNNNNDNNKETSGKTTGIYLVEHRDDFRGNFNNKKWT